MMSIFLGLGTLVVSSIAVIIFSALSIEIVLEGAALIVAILVSSVCLRQIYEEHQIRENIERRLKQSLFNQIRTLEPGLSNYHALTHYLDDLLETYGNEGRLKKLTQFQNSPEAIYSLIQRFKQYQATQSAIKDLGLSW